MSLSGTNNKLKKAKENKNDEFYTRYEDIESFINQYQEHLKDKVIYIVIVMTLVSVTSISFLRLTLQS